MSTVLVVEDDPDIRELLEMRLQIMSHQVTSAGSAQEALAALADQGVPDFAILDIMMPYVNGFELLRTLREDPAYATLPVIILTARRLSGDLMEAQDLGAAYLTKPIDTEQLSDAVERALELAGPI